MPEKFIPDTPLSEINVTPFVDVMLVLLVIFMVTAPMFSQGLPVSLPEARAPALVSEKPLVVSISKEQAIYLGERQVGLEDLNAALIPEPGAKVPEVLLKSDQNVPYGLVVKVMSILKEAGVEKLGIVTAPAAQEVK
jgi:biopolymer transport protein TolR|uniref:Biopolymer transporter ExbD n=1 Tax=Desulfobacca acetoxidans TaxID=60893 RepID=A0A7C3Z4I8_9BACT